MIGRISLSVAALSALTLVLGSGCSAAPGSAGDEVGTQKEPLRNCDPDLGCHPDPPPHCSAPMPFDGSVQFEADLAALGCTGKRFVTESTMVDPNDPSAVYGLYEAYCPSSATVSDAFCSGGAPITASQLAACYYGVAPYFSTYPNASMCGPGGSRMRWDPTCTGGQCIHPS